MLDDLSEGDSPKIEAAANMARNHAIRLTAACHVIAEDIMPSCESCWCSLLRILHLDMTPLCESCCIGP